MPDIEIIAVINSVEEKVKAVLLGGGKWWTHVLPIAEIVSTEVENAHEDLKGEDKKAMAILIFDQLWFKYANIKWIPDFLERPLVDHLFSLAIDSAVATFNKLGVFKHHN